MKSIIIIKYNKGNLLLSHEERINDGVETRPICFDCNEITGEWNREFKQKHFCKKCLYKRFPSLNSLHPTEK